MKVLKFGGTSVGTPESMSRVIEILKSNIEKEAVIVVLSAMSGVTDELEQLSTLAISGFDDSIKARLQKLQEKHEAVADYILSGEVRIKAQSIIHERITRLNNLLLGVSLVNDLSPKSQARIVVFGELLSSHLLHLACSSFVSAKYVFTPDYIITNEHFINAEVDFNETNKRLEELSKSSFKLAVAPGFMASSQSGEITTLGRGGSDYTAAIIAAGVNAHILEIWTDVNGIYSADPRMVESAYPIEELTFQEVMELSHFGAKVIYPPALHPAFNKKIELWVKNTFEPENRGTQIVEKKTTHQTGKYITGFSSINDISLITLSGSGMVGIAGFSARFFGGLARAKVNVILITQASSEHSICVAVRTVDWQKANAILREEFVYEMSISKVETPVIEHEFSILAIVGENMNKTKGISGKAFSVLGKNGINIHAIAQGASELNISLVVKTKNTRKALNVLHEAFFLSEKRIVNLYLTGIGNVGGKLMDLIMQQKSYLLKDRNLHINIRGITNSRKMLIPCEEDLNGNWREYFEKHSQKADIEEFINIMKEDNLRNSVFVDNTASEKMPDYYLSVFDASIPIVTCNKIAASSQMKSYIEFKETAKKNRTNFLYESNVGAGLPLIRTINHLRAAGDTILKIEAVLSGSLNFILNEFHNGMTFRKAVEGAMEAGFTEPDPRIDLSGTDVARKILILARESGMNLEMEEIVKESFLPEKCINATNTNAFLETLDSEAQHFNDLLKKAEQTNGKLRFVAVFDNGKAKVGLQIVDKKSPFYSIEGKDNIIVLTTHWYNQQPLVIKGAGAGAEVTASGIFSDIMTLVSN